MSRSVTRPAGIEFPATGTDLAFTETPADRVMRTLTRLVDSDGILAGASEDDIAREAGVTRTLARIELGCLLASQTLMVFAHKEGPIWFLPNYDPKDEL